MILLQNSENELKKVTIPTKAKEVRLETTNPPTGQEENCLCLNTEAKQESVENLPRTTSLFANE